MTIIGLISRIGIIRIIVIIVTTIRITIVAVVATTVRIVIVTVVATTVRITIVTVVATTVRITIVVITVSAYVVIIIVIVFTPGCGWDSFWVGLDLPLSMSQQSHLYPRSFRFVQMVCLHERKDKVFFQGRCG